MKIFFQRTEKIVQPNFVSIDFYYTFATHLRDSFQCSLLEDEKIAQSVERSFTN